MDSVATITAVRGITMEMQEDLADMDMTAAAAVQIGRSESILTTSRRAVGDEAVGGAAIGDEAVGEEAKDEVEARVAKARAATTSPRHSVALPQRPTSVSFAQRRIDTRAL